MEKTMTLTTSSIARLCGALAALLLLGCGSNNAVTTNSDPAAAFTGSWTFGSGSIQPMCKLGSLASGTALSIPSFDLMGDTMMVTHVSATEVSTKLTGTGVMCNVNFTVSGSTATAVTGQTCLVTVMADLGTGAMSIPVTIDISTWTLAVSGDMLTIAMTGTATAEGGLVNCAPTADGMATKVNAGG
jgi:hypothetical protein